MKPHGAPNLADVARTAIIVAHEEDTGELRRALELEGFACEEVRGPYAGRELAFSASVRCLINHSNAWRRVCTEGCGYVLVVEADFVPVRGLGRLPLPFVPGLERKAMAWLYSVGPVIYHVERETGAIYGHNAGTVAYVLDACVARECLALFEDEVGSGDGGEYRAWEVSIPVRLRWERGVTCYIPYRMYGEHGGFPNPEHSRNRVRAWHEADCLAGRLHFLPAYARGRRWVYWLRRARGRARGFYRLARGKYFDGWAAWFRSREDRMLRLRIAFERLL